jgi:hypothetical protein
MNRQSKKKNQERPFGGVYIYAKNINNNGHISSEGDTAVTHVVTDRYSGKGEVSSRSTGHTKIVEKVHHKSSYIPIIGILIAFVSIPWWPLVFQNIKGAINFQDKNRLSLSQSVQQNSAQANIKPSKGKLRSLETLETGKTIGQLPNNVYFFASSLSIKFEIKDPKIDFLNASSKDTHYNFELQKIENRYYLIGYISDEAYSVLGNINDKSVYTILFPNRWGGATHSVAIPFDSIYTINNRSIDLDQEKSIDIFDIGFKEVIEDPEIHKIEPL